METISLFKPAEERMAELGMDIITIRKEVSFALQHINKSQKLQECSPISKIAAVINIANIGLTLNPTAKEAYLIPRYSSISKCMECYLEPSYIGLVKLLTDAGSVKSMVCNIVYENDLFEMDLADNVRPIVHKPQLVKANKGNMLGAYALATLPDGNRQAEWMDIDELHAIRERSETYLAFKAGKIKSCTWDTDETEMMRKTVIKRIYKYLPRTDRMTHIDAAVALDNEDYAATDGQVNYIQSLLENSTYDHEQRQYIENELVNLSAIRASQIINDLQLNQLDRITQAGSYNQGDIQTHINELK